MYLNYHDVGLHFRYGDVSLHGNTYLAWNGCFSWKPKTWHHVAITWEQTSGVTMLKMYADGAKVAETTANLMLNDSANWKFAQKIPGSTYGNFNGSMDEVKWYGRKLNDNEIGKLYQQSVQPELLYPNNNDLFVSSKCTITWRPSPRLAAINLQYSVNNGIVWQNIAVGVNTDAGKFVWNVPAQGANDVLMRIANPTSGKSISINKTRIVSDIKELDLQAFFPFTYNANDAGRTKYRPIVYGAATVKLSSGEKMNGCLEFNGTTDKLVIENFATSQQFSLAFWIKTTDSIATICSLWGAGYIGINNTENQYKGKILAYIENPKANYTFFLDTIKINDGQWHFVALSVANDSMRLFVDTRQVGVSKVLGAIDYDYNFFVVGNYDYNSSMAYSGLLDELRFYNRGIDKNTIEEIRKAMFTMVDNEVVIIRETVTDTLIIRDTIRTVVYDTIFRNDTIIIRDTIRITGSKIIATPNSGNEKVLTSFPNPSTGRFTLQLPANECIPVSIFDNQGRLLQNYPACTGNTVIEGLKPGTYFIRAIAKDRPYTLKQIIK